MSGLALVIVLRNIIFSLFNLSYLNILRLWTITLLSLHAVHGKLMPSTSLYSFQQEKSVGEVDDEDTDEDDDSGLGTTNSLITTTSPLNQQQQQQFWRKQQQNNYLIQEQQQQFQLIQQQQQHSQQQFLTASNTPFTLFTF
uniref:Candidate secreted effector n=1 Tax=Meloidogyne incognita TaxID=6306 RepID=A0A914NQ04_MELIC